MCTGIYIFFGTNVYIEEEGVTFEGKMEGKRGKRVKEWAGKEIGEEDIKSSCIFLN